MSSTPQTDEEWACFPAGADINCFKRDLKSYTGIRKLVLESLAGYFSSWRELAGRDSKGCEVVRMGERMAVLGRVKESFLTWWITVQPVNKCV